ncbi:MAG: type II toxin-antitoxin system RelE/ParE family toxin, partial [Pseudomonadota bacterium]
IERCQAIAEGTAFTRDCTQLVGREVALKYAKAGMHYVVFVESDREITIIDFIHGRSDLPGHLARLAERNQDG